MTTIACVDPGQTIGWCVLKYSTYHVAVLESGEIETEEGDAVFGVDRLTPRILIHVPALIIYEKWRPRNKAGTNPNDTCQVIGALRLWARQNMFRMQGQWEQERMSVDEARLKGTEFWLRGGKGHKRQALRHGLAYLADTVMHKPTRAIVYGEG